MSASVSILHPGQVRVLRRARRYNTVACGRRWGKTTLGLMLAWAGRPTALRTGFDVGWVAPNYKLLDEAWRMAKRIFRAYITRTDAQLHRMELSTGAALDFWTLEDPDAGRGRKYGLLIVDEAAMARHLKQAWEAALEPTLTDHDGGAWFFSTPKGRNYFWELSQRCGADPEWAHHHAPSAENPHLPRAALDRRRKNTAERIFAQEYLAQFLEDGGGVFRRVMAAVDTRLKSVSRTEPGESIVIGVDWGRHNDFTVILALRCPAGGTRGEVIDTERFTDIDFATQRARLTAFALRHPGAPIVVERNSFGMVQAEELQRDQKIGARVRAFDTNAQSKAQIIEALALGFEQGEVGLPADDAPWLISELIAYEQTRSASGLMRYSAPGGAHDDGVMALAIAWHAKAWGGPRPQYRRSFAPLEHAA